MSDIEVSAHSTYLSAVATASANYEAILTCIPNATVAAYMTSVHTAYLALEAARKAALEAYVGEMIGKVTTTTTRKDITP